MYFIEGSSFAGEYVVLSKTNGPPPNRQAALRQQAGDGLVDRLRDLVDGLREALGVLSDGVRDMLDHGVGDRMDLRDRALDGAGDGVGRGRRVVSAGRGGVGAAVAAGAGVRGVIVAGGAVSRRGVTVVSRRRGRGLAGRSVGAGRRPTVASVRTVSTRPDEDVCARTVRLGSVTSPAFASAVPPASPRNASVPPNRATAHSAAAISDPPAPRLGMRPRMCIGACKVS